MGLAQHATTGMPTMGRSQGDTSSADEIQKTKPAKLHDWLRFFRVSLCLRDNLPAALPFAYQHMKAYLKSFTLSPFNALGSLVFFCALIPSDFRGDVLRGLSWFWLTWTKRESLPLKSKSQAWAWDAIKVTCEEIYQEKSPRLLHCIPGLGMHQFCADPKKQEQSHSQAIFLHIFLILWAAPLVHYPTRLWSPLLEGPDEGEDLYKIGLAMHHRWHVLFLK